MNDSAWGAEHIRGMLEGEILTVIVDPASGRAVEDIKQVPTAFEIRSSIRDGNGGLEDLCDAIQLSKAIRSITDYEIRAFMVACFGLGAMNPDAAEGYVIDAGLRSNRSMLALYNRGIALIRRNEKIQHQLLYHVRESGGMSSKPVCWRCRKRQVKIAGEECDNCPALRSGFYEGVRPKSIKRMSVADLAAGQFDNDADYDTWSTTIPGYGKVRTYEEPLSYHEGRI